MYFMQPAHLHPTEHRVSSTESNQCMDERLEMFQMAKECLKKRPISKLFSTTQDTSNFIASSRRMSETSLIQEEDMNELLFGEDRA